jgi:hypothetical protein
MGIVSCAPGPGQAGRREGACRAVETPASPLRGIGASQNSSSDATPRLSFRTRVSDTKDACTPVRRLSVSEGGCTNVRSRPHRTHNPRVRASPHALLAAGALLPYAFPAMWALWPHRAPTGHAIDPGLSSKSWRGTSPTLAPGGLGICAGVQVGGRSPEVQAARRWRQPVAV